eukprot:811185-Rhodomonas_salina.9
MPEGIAAYDGEVVRSQRRTCTLPSGRRARSLFLLPARRLSLGLFVPSRSQHDPQTSESSTTYADGLESGIKSRPNIDQEARGPMQIIKERERSRKGLLYPARPMRYPANVGLRTPHRVLVAWLRPRLVPAKDFGTA